MRVLDEGELHAGRAPSLTTRDNSLGGMMASEEEEAPNEAELVDGAETAAFAQLDTPATFLTGLSDALKSTDGVDADLAGIITDHLLTDAPHANAVFNAKAAIIELAGQRATAPAPDGPEASNG